VGHGVPPCGLHARENSHEDIASSSRRPDPRSAQLFASLSPAREPRRVVGAQRTAGAIWLRRRGRRTRQVRLHRQGQRDLPSREYADGSSDQAGDLARGIADLGSSSTARQLAATLSRLHTVAADYLAQLQRLKQPSGDHAAINRFLTPLGQIVDAIGKAAVAIGNGQAPAAIGLLEQAGPVAQDATDAARAYGMRQCETVLAALA
jgi:hypothetical protein